MAHRPPVPHPSVLAFCQGCGQGVLFPKAGLQPCPECAQEVNVTPPTPGPEYTHKERTVQAPPRRPSTVGDLCASTPRGTPRHVGEVCPEHGVVHVHTVTLLDARDAYDAWASDVARAQAQEAIVLAAEVTLECLRTVRPLDAEAIEVAEAEVEKQTNLAEDLSEICCTSREEAYRTNVALMSAMMRSAPDADEVSGDAGNA